VGGVCELSGVGGAELQVSYMFETSLLEVSSGPGSKMLMVAEGGDTSRCIGHNRTDRPFIKLLRKPGKREGDCCLAAYVCCVY
jgi:hypothetical protein